MFRAGQSQRGPVLAVAVAIAALVSACGGSSGTSSSESTSASNAQSTAQGTPEPGAAGTATTATPEPGVCKGCTPPLLYRGGPVLATNGLTLTAVYWAPQGYSFPDGYVSLVNQYLTDIAAASGKTDNTYAIDTEYSQTSNGTTAAVKYSVQAGTPVMDTTAYPATADGCPVAAPNTACVSNDQLTTELSAQLTQGRLAADLGHMYLMFLPPNVATTDGKSSAGFCAYHSSYELPNGGGTVVWANEPYTPGCFGGQSPNGNPPADTQIDTLSHEISEAMTDPLPGQASWIDSSGNEIGDECNFNYGPPLGTADPNNAGTSAYNQVLNGHNYYAQTMFSNASYQAQGQGKGCIQGAYTATTPSATVTTTGYRVAPAAGSPVSATVTLSSTRLAADGSSTSTATLSLVDGNGEPVAGDHVHFLVQTGKETNAACGTVSPADGVSDAAGEVRTTYTASTANQSCIVLADDVESGASNWGTVYQGTSASTQPTITDASVPTSLTPGGAADTFTVTATNPSSDALRDVRFDVFLTGDDKGAAGVMASQVHIAYSDAATGGSMTPLHLTGETVKQGEIEGSAMPDKAADLPAGASSTVTFQISIDSGAPTTASTGAPLHLEVDFDQFNPADGTTDNLDYVGPADIPVG